jgi:hypothetical protein
LLLLLNLFRPRLQSFFSCASQLPGGITSTLGSPARGALCAVLVALLSAASSTCYATAVAAFRSRDEIVIGADSATSDLNGNVTPEKSCKIWPIGRNSFVAVQGMSDDLPAKYNIVDIIQETVAKHRKLGAKVSAVQEAVISPLQAALTRLNTQEPSAFRRNAIETPPLNLTFVGLEDGELWMYAQKYRVKSVGVEGRVTVDVESRSCPGDCPKQVARVLGSPTGEADSVRFDRAYPTSWTDDKVIVVRNFLQMVRDEPGVSPPFAILSITKRGSKWICGGNCQPRRSSINPGRQQPRN